jgi:hypothetical protein
MHTSKSMLGHSGSRSWGSQIPFHCPHQIPCPKVGLWILSCGVQTDKTVFTGMFHVLG